VHRLSNEFGSPVRLDHLEYTIARRTRPADAAALNRQRGVEVLTRSDGVLLALFLERWRLAAVQRDLPDAELVPLVAASD
jgi:peptide chain release factor 3